MMKVDIRVIPGAKRVSVKKKSGRLKVYLTARAIEGKANKALIKILADYFKVAKFQVEIIKGLKSKDKTISILSK